jgi:hypothetical protein
MRQARALGAYLRQVEPIRLGVNRLLDGADPILEGYAEHHLGAGKAQRRMGALESRFAAYTARVNELRPTPPELTAAQRRYAHTYVLEDAYLRALAAAIPGRDFDALPQTEDAQRAAIVAWRIRLQAVANQVGVHLPADIHRAGRGEIAPSPLGS